MSVLQIADKASEVVAKKTPRVIKSLKRIKLFLIGFPLIGALFGIFIEQNFAERQVVHSSFEIGSVMIPGESEPLDIAEEGPMKSRMRLSSRTIAEKYPKAALLTISLEMPVVRLTATAEGSESAGVFLREVMDTEVAFQNNRFNEFSDIFKERQELFEGLIAEKTEQINGMQEAIAKTANAAPSAMQLSTLHRSLAIASDKRGEFKEALNAMKYQQRIDLLIGISEVTREPGVLATSAFFRPLIYGAIGFALGLLLTGLLFLITVVRALSGESKPEEIPSS